MKYFGKIQDPKDLVTKEYVDNAVPTTLAELGQDATHRTVTDEEKTRWNSGQDLGLSVVNGKLCVTYE